MCLEDAISWGAPANGALEVSVIKSWTSFEGGNAGSIRVTISAKRIRHELEVILCPHALWVIDLDIGSDGLEKNAVGKTLISEKDGCSDREIFEKAC